MILPDTCRTKCRGKVWRPCFLRFFPTNVVNDVGESGYLGRHRRESRHLSPFPELMVNFIGTVHELKPECVDDCTGQSVSDHIAPSLMMSGSLGKPTRRIQSSFEKRYYVNFFDNLFEDVSVRWFLSKYGIE